MDDSQTLYDLIHDYILQNPIEITELVGILETIKIECMMEALGNE